jgi:molybdate transport system substrate-binding protein
MHFRPVHSFVALCLAATLCAAPAFAEELTVSAAASLTNAFTEIKTLFEKRYPGNTVATNFAASNPLLQQIRQGAPADVFASADQETMDTAGNEKLIDPATRKDFARNSLVLVVPAGGKVKSLKDLTPAMRIAAGNPDSVPAGRYARDSLTAAGLYERLKPAVIQGNSVRQVLDYVARGEADAGFVYATDAAVLKDRVTVVETMGGHKPVLYPAAVVAASGHKKLAKSFADFLFTPEAVAVLQKYGFSKP